MAAGALFRRYRVVRPKLRGVVMRDGQQLHLVGGTAKAARCPEQPCSVNRSALIKLVRGPSEQDEFLPFRQAAYRRFQDVPDSVLAWPLPPAGRTLPPEAVNSLTEHSPSWAEWGAAPRA